MSLTGIDQYTKILLNFENVNNPYEDECNNTWQVTGNPELVYEENEYMSEHVISFPNNSERNYLLLEKEIVLGGDIDFTIDGWAYIDSQTAQYGRIFDFRTKNSTSDSPRFEFCKRGSSNSIQCAAFNLLSFNYIVDGFVGVWFHFALVYTHDTNKLIFYTHGKKKFENTVNFTETHFKYFYLGGTDPKYSPNDTQLVGKIAWFRLSTTARWTEDEYDVSKTSTPTTLLFITKRNVINNDNIIKSPYLGFRFK